MSGADSLRGRTVELVEAVRALPYLWPAPPDADAARRDGCGSCASKHALLRAELAATGVQSRPLFVAGRLVPAVLADDPELADARDLVEVHECLTVTVPGTGPCLVDITWDPPLVDAGLPGTLDWDGTADMAVALGDPLHWWAPDPARLRAEKELLRSRLYDGADRELRDRVLAAMSLRFERWRLT